ncbi:MAG: uncharacterized protein JWP97_137 [Labilithrix sp.]|nr:uncharacterized protein [Labilithrix sp.]
MNSSKRRPFFFFVGGITLCLTTFGAAPARADSTCISAYEQAQTLRKDGKPQAAKAQAQICAQASCPSLLVKDCSRWQTELEALIPTVLLDARAPSGGLRADVRVKVDGNVVAEKIDGRAIAIEAGAHAFTFEAEGAATVEQTVTLKEGERNRKVSVTMLPAPVTSTTASPVPTGAWVFGGVAVAALATSAVFAIDGLGKKSDLDQCRPRCAAGDVDAMSARFTLADVALGAGVVAGAAALYLFFARPGGEPKSSARASSVPSPFAGPINGGAAAGLSGRF